MDELVERKYPKHIRQAEGTAAVVPAADHHRLELLPVPADRCAVLRVRLAEDQLQEVPVRRHDRRRHRLRDLHLSRRLACCASLSGRSPSGTLRPRDIARDRRDRRSCTCRLSRSAAASRAGRSPIDPRKRARNSGSSRRSTSTYGCRPLRSQPRDGAIEPGRIERIPHHDLAAGVKAHAAALPHRDQHRVRRQSIAHELRGLRDSALPSAAARTPADRRRRACRRCRGPPRRSESRRPCRCATASARVAALARISSTTSAGIRKRRYHHSGNRLSTAGRSRSRRPRNASSSTAPLRLMPSNTSGASSAERGHDVLRLKQRARIIRQVVVDVAQR